MSPSDSAAPAARAHLPQALAAACDIASLGVLTYLVVSRVFWIDFRVNLLFGADRLLLVLIVAALVVVRRLAAAIDPRLTLALFTGLTGTAACLIGLTLLGADVEARLRSALIPVRARLSAVLFQTREPIGMYRLDDRYGYVHVPGVTGTARTVEYAATYTIDREGYRRIPSPPVPRGTVVFLGDSFTFGDGVNDDETFPYLLATEHWTDLRVVNAGVGGWGLTQFHLKLSDLAARPPVPDAVVLVLISDDLRRSHLRPPAEPGIERRLEWIDGRFVSRENGRRSTTAGRAFRDTFRETPELLREEARQATSTLETMAATARASNVAFAVVLADDTAGYPPETIYALARAGVPVLDLTRMDLSLFPYDQHPDAAGHRRLAAAIASSFLTALVYGRHGPSVPAS